MMKLQVPQHVKMAKAAKTNDKKQESEKNAPKTEVKELKLSDMTWKGRYKFLMENITVEPMLACYIIPSVFASLATQNLNLEKACRVNLGYSTEVCDALSVRNTANYTSEEKAVQQLVASMGVWKTMLQSALPAFLIMFVGLVERQMGPEKTLHALTHRWRTPHRDRTHVLHVLFLRAAHGSGGLH
jgi:hypothetical protein